MRLWIAEELEELFVLLYLIFSCSDRDSDQKHKRPRMVFQVLH